MVVNGSAAPSRTRMSALLRDGAPLLTLGTSDSRGHVAAATSP
jgi:hypothetical protein